MNPLSSQVVLFPLLPFLDLRDLRELSTLNKEFHTTFSKAIRQPLIPYFPYSTNLVAGEWIFVQKNQRDPLLCFDSSANKNHAKFEGVNYAIKSGKGVVIENFRHFAGAMLFQRNYVFVESNLDSFDPQPERGFTVEAWIAIDPRSIKGREFENPIVSKHGWGTGYELRINESIPTFVITTSRHEEVGREYADRKNQPQFQAGKYYHIAGTFNGRDKLAVYKNGVLVAQKIIREGVAFTHHTGNLTFGVSSGWTERTCSLNLLSVRITHMLLSPCAFMAFPK